MDERLDIFIHEGETGYTPGQGGSSTAASGSATAGGVSAKASTAVVKGVSGIRQIVGKFLPMFAGIAGVIALVKSSKIFGAFGNAFMSVIGAMIDLLLMPLVPILLPALKVLIALLPAIKLIGDILSFLLEPLAVSIAGVSEVIIGAMDGIAKGYKFVNDKLNLAIDAITKFFGGKILDFWELIKEQLSKFWGTVTDKTFWSSVWEAITNWFGTEPAKFWTFLTSELDKWWDGSVTPFWESISTAISDWWGEDIPKFWDDVKSAIGKFWGTITKKTFWQEVGDRIKTWFYTTAEGIETFWSGVGRRIRNFLGSIASPIGTFWDLVKKSLSTFFTNNPALKPIIIPPTLPILPGISGGHFSPSAGIGDTSSPNKNVSVTNTFNVVSPSPEAAANNIRLLFSSDLDNQLMRLA